MELDFNDNVLKDSNKDRVTTVEKLAERDWNRDSLEQRFREVRNNRDTIQSIIQDLVEDFSGIPSESVLDEQWSGYLDQKGVDEDNKQPNDDLPAAYFLMTKRKVDALIRISVWQARLEELENFALRKFNSQYGELLEEYRFAKTWDDVQDMIKDVVDSEFDKRMAEEKSSIQKDKRDVESVAQAVRNQQMTLVKTFEKLNEQNLQGFDSEAFESLLENKLEDFMTEQGVFTIDQERLENFNKEAEVQAAAEAAAEDVVGGSSESGFSIDEEELTDQQVEFLETALSFQRKDEDADLQDIADDLGVNIGVASKKITDIRKKGHDLPEILQDLG